LGRIGDVPAVAASIDLHIGFLPANSHRDKAMSDDNDRLAGTRKLIPHDGRYCIAGRESGRWADRPINAARGWRRVQFPGLQLNTGANARWSRVRGWMETSSPATRSTPSARATSPARREGSPRVALPSGATLPAITRYSGPVLFVADLFHPVDVFAVQRLLNGDMRHRRRGRRPVPMLLAGREPDHTAGPSVL